MPANIEVKARVRTLDKLQERIQSMAGEPAGKFIQEDVFFDVPRGRLKMRAETNRPKEFIYYQRADETGPKYSAYFRHESADPLGTEEELRRLFGAKATVRKMRTLYWLEGARIHLDNVEGLGFFVEIEVPVKPGHVHRARALAQHLIERLGIAREDFIPVAYEELLAGQTALLSH